MKRIIILGFMGSGKSTIGRALADRLKIPFLDTDKMIEAKRNMTVNEIFTVLGEPVFRQDEIHEIQNVSDQDAFVLSVGGGLPAIPGMMDKLNQLGTTVFLNVSQEELLRRLLLDRASRPLLSKKTELELADFIRELNERRKNDYAKAQIILSSDQIKLEDLLACI